MSVSLWVSFTIINGVILFSRWARFECECYKPQASLTLLLWFRNGECIVPEEDNIIKGWKMRVWCQSAPGKSASLLVCEYRDTSLTSPLFFCILSCRLIQRWHSLAELSPRWVPPSCSSLSCVCIVCSRLVCVDCFGPLSELMHRNLMNASGADITQLLCDRMLTKTFTTLENAL